MENIILYLFEYIKNDERTILLLKNYSFSSKKLLNTIPFKLLLPNHKLDEEGFKYFFDNNYHKDKYYQYLLIKTQLIPDEYLEQYSEDLNWCWISLYQTLKEYQLKKYSDIVNWFFVSSKQKMSINFIIENNELIDWYSIVRNPYLNLEFINSCSSYIDWDSVSRYVILNVYFFKKHYDKINWEIISKERELEEDFIIEFIDFIDFKLLALNEYTFYYSERLIKKASPNLDNYNIYNINARIIQDYWRIKIT